MKILIWDTETTGLFPKGALMTDLKAMPRIIQIAWDLFDTDFPAESIAKHVFLIKPDGWKVPAEKFWIDNGFSQAKSMAEGAPMDQVLGLFHLHLTVTDCMVAHNADFDRPVTGAELIRYKINTGRKIPIFCTMKATTDICKIPSQYGKGYKWPKAMEAYQFLFGKGFDGAHDAGADVQATKEIFIELVNMGIVKLSDLTPLKST